MQEMDYRLSDGSNICKGETPARSLPNERDSSETHPFVGNRLTPRTCVSFGRLRFFVSGRAVRLLEPNTSRRVQFPPRFSKLGP